jgi:toxin CcdB
MARYDVFRIDGTVASTCRPIFSAASIPDWWCRSCRSTSAPRPAGRLNPVFELDDGAYVLFPQLMGAVPIDALGPRIDNLLRYEDRVRSALDMIFLGF